MNLKENYERLFGKMNECDFSGRTVVSKPKPQTINEADMGKWLKLHKSFINQNPNRKLTLANNEVRLDGFLIESADKFLDRDIPDMIRVVRNANRSIINE